MGKANDLCAVEGSTVMSRRRRSGGGGITSTNFQKMAIGAMVLALCLSACSKSAQSAAPSNRFVGRWNLVATEAKHSDGRVTADPDLGPDAIGFIEYDAGGHMSVQIMKPNRPVLKDEDRPTHEEAYFAFTGYDAYEGSYEIHEQDGYIIHKPNLALWPNIVGTAQKRMFKFEGNRLRLTPPPFHSLAGELLEETLIWERVP